MLTTKNYYSNPNLLKKIRIRTIEENQNIDFRKILENSFFGTELSNTNLENTARPDSSVSIQA